MGSVPYGNPAGANQANPALQSTSLSGATAPMGASTVPAPIPGGSTPTSTNPYMIGSPTPATTGAVPGAAIDQATQQQMNQSKQWTDIYGKGTGGAIASEYQGMQGANSAAYQAYLASMAPTWAAQQATYGQGMGAGGVSPNSTVNAIGLSNLLANQAATASGVDASMIMQNQTQRLNLLQGMEGASAQEVASSGWDVFGKVVGEVGSLAGDVMGMGGAVGGLSNLFGMGASAAGEMASQLPSFGQFTSAGGAINMAGGLPEMAGMDTSAFSSVPANVSLAPQTYQNWSA